MNFTTRFPIKGLSELQPLSDQDAQTSPDLLNVVAFDREGRLRGAVRPGQSKWCPAQVSGSNRVQAIATIGATYVKPVIESNVTLAKGRAASATGFSLIQDNGTPVEIAIAETFLGSCFGDDGNFYILSHSGVNCYLSSYTPSGTKNWGPTQAFISSTAPAYQYMIGIAADSGVIYVHWLYVENRGLLAGGGGECIMRFYMTDGSNVDYRAGTDDATWITLGAHNGVNSYSGGVGGLVNLNSGIAVYQGLIAYLGSWYSTTEAAQNYCVYIARVSDASVVYAAKLSSLATTVRDIAWTTRGILMFLTNTASYSYMNYTDLTAEGSTSTQLSANKYSMDWSEHHEAYIVSGSNVLNSTSVVGIARLDSTPYADGSTTDPLFAATQGTLATASPGAATAWTQIRSHGDGEISVWANSGNVRRFSATLGTIWSITTLAQQQKTCAGSRLNSGFREQGTTRVQVAIAVSNGTVAKVSTSGVTSVTSGSSALSSSPRRIYCAKYGVLTFFADGANAKYYDGTLNSVLSWNSKVRRGGKVPVDSNGGFSYIERWGNRLLLFGYANDLSNYYFSGSGDPFNFMIDPETSGAPISGRLSPAGLFPGKLHSACPFNDDVLLMAGDGQIYQMTGDPATNANFSLVSSNVGFAPGRSWCLDGYGSVYFAGSMGGFYKLELNNPPRRISTAAVDARMMSVDTATSDFSLAWDEIRQGIWILISDHAGDIVQQWFYCARTEGWFPIQHGSASLTANCTELFDLDSAGDQVILIGCEDGYIRRFDDAAVDDDGVEIDCHVVLGPWSDSGTSDLLIRRLGFSGVVDTDVKLQLQSGDTLGHAVSGQRVRFERRIRGDQAAFRPQIRAKAFSLKLKPEYGGSIGFERIDCDFEIKKGI